MQSMDATSFITDVLDLAAGGAIGRVAKVYPMPGGRGTTGSWRTAPRWCAFMAVAAAACRSPPSTKIATIVIVVLLGVTRFGYLIMPWFAGLAGRITTVGT